jgi:lipopolysaccharide biosynthesis glycosyltransferase
MSSSEESARLVVTSCDDRYLWPWACALYSAVRNADVRTRFLLANVNGLLSSAGQQMAREYLSFLEIEGDVVDVSIDVESSEQYQWNATTYARLALMDTLDERFMWLDADTILCPGWTQIFADADQLMADPHIVACGVRDRSDTLDLMRKAGTNKAYQAAGDQYFNAGVIIVDPLRWRLAGIDREWAALAAAEAEWGFDYRDQDVLNYLLAGKAGLLSARFNHIVSESAMGTESILHFAGFPKPWRLSESGQAFFVATEVANFDKPHHQISGGGRAWELFPRYWEVERALTASMAEKGRLDLASAYDRYRQAQLVDLSLRQKVKLSGIRLLSRRLLSR